MNDKLTKVAGLMAFVISGIFTIILMQSGVTGILAKILMVFIALIMDFAKVMFFYRALTDKKLSGGIKGVFFSTALVLFLISIFASQGFLSNSVNETKNFSLKDSAEYAAKQSNIATQTDLLEIKKDEIAELKKQSEANMKNNIITKNKEILDKIDAKSKELAEATTTLQDIQNSDVIETLETNGYSALLGTIAKWLNANPEYKDNPILVQDLETWLFTIISIIFEIVAVLLFYLGEHDKTSALHKIDEAPITKEKIGSDNISVEHKIIDENALRELLRGNDIDNKPHAKIGFVAEMKESLCSPEDTGYLNIGFDRYIEYLKYLYLNEKNGLSPGTDRFRRDTSLSMKEIKGIRFHLNNLGVLRVNPKEKNTEVLISDLVQAIEILEPTLKKEV